jgi:transposase
VHAELIFSAPAAKSDMTLSELREQLREHGVAVAISTLWRFFKRRKITRQKKTAHAAEQRRSRRPCGLSTSLAALLCCAGHSYATNARSG